MRNYTIIWNNLQDKAKNYPYITRVGVFGSCARYEETPNSDIDILIDYDGSSDECINDLGGFMEDMERLIQDRIDYVTMPSLMKSSEKTFKRNVLREVKWIYNSK